jgi:hypothetical protein
MLQPVLGDVTVDERVVGNGGETKQEQEPQPQGGERDPEKKSEGLAHKLAHAKNIPQLLESVGTSSAAIHAV